MSCQRLGVGGWNIWSLPIIASPSHRCININEIHNCERELGRKIEEENRSSLPVANTYWSRWLLLAWFRSTKGNLWLSHDVYCWCCQAGVDGKISGLPNTLHWLNPKVISDLVVHVMSNPVFYLLPFSWGKWEIKWCNTLSPNSWFFIDCPLLVIFILSPFPPIDPWLTTRHEGLNENVCGGEGC